MTAQNATSFIEGVRRKSKSPILRYEIAFVVLSAIVIAIYFMLSGDTQGFVYDAFGFSAVAGIVIGIFVHKPAWPLPWYLLALGFFIFVTGDVIARNYFTFFGNQPDGLPPFPSVADWLFIFGNLLNLVAVFLLLRSREPYKDTGSLIDAFIVGTTGAAFAWIFIMDRYVKEEGTLLQKLITLNTPIIDLVILVLTTRLIFGTGLRTTSFYLILGGFISSMAADIFYSQSRETYVSGDFIDVGWLIFFLCFCAAGLHPSMARVAEPGANQPMRLTTQRLLMLTGAVLLVPVVTMLQWQRGESTDTLVFAGASGIAFMLVVLRMAGLVHTVELAQGDLRRALDREQVMKQASLHLVSATSQADVFKSAADAIGTLISESAEGRVLSASGDGRLEVVAATNHRDRMVIGRSLTPSELSEELRAGLEAGTPQLIQYDGHEPLWTQLNLANRAGTFVLSPVVTPSAERAVLALNVSNETATEAASLLTALSSQVSLALERVSLAERLHRRESEERFHSLVQNSSDVILIIDSQSKITYASPSVRRVFGVPEDWFVGSDLFSWVHPDDYLQARRYFGDIIAVVGSIRSTDFRMRDGRSSWRSVEIISNNLLDDTSVRGIVINARDISERKRAEEQLTYQAFHDSLTSLPNRNLFMDRLGRAVARSEFNTNSGTAVLFIDLDRFKVVNDSLGHEVGDLLLREAGVRISNCVRTGDMVARLGGDEFTVMLENVAGIDEPINTARRVIAAFERPLLIQDREVFVDTSVGIAIAMGHRTDPGELLRQADIAMYQAKEQGGQSFAIFDAEMGTTLLFRLELETDLRHAIERNELELNYQPEIDLETSRIVATEALVRWNHPRFGYISPAEFIPLAEETGLILEIGGWVLRHACLQAADWAEEFSELELVMSVNLSVRQYLHPGIADEIATVLRETKLSAKKLRLEITETILMDEKETNRATLEQLHDLGIQLALDDFGSGYSSLGYLKRLPVETLKIDQIFIKGLGRDPHDAAIVETIATLGHRFGMSVTAEGVETRQQATAVKQLGCDHAQGYIFSEPVTAAKLSELLKKDAILRLEGVAGD
jgi:diguanylate cyclase (GGDEF)-like protein/PAS domain S-box-containing protein